MPAEGYIAVGVCYGYLASLYRNEAARILQFAHEREIEFALFVQTYCDIEIIYNDVDIYAAQTYIESEAIVLEGIQR